MCVTLLHKSNIDCTCDSYPYENFYLVLAHNYIQGCNNLVNTIELQFLNTPGFLKLLLSRKSVCVSARVRAHVCVRVHGCVCGCVCVRPQAIRNNSREMRPE